MASPLSLDGRVVVITGGAQGIGEATARLCTERGARVVIIDFKRESGESVAASIGAAFIAADVRDDAQVAAAFEFVRAQYGRMDALVCAAGVLKGAYQQPEELSLDDFDLTVGVNVRGPFLCARHGAALLEESGGVMVIIASGAGVIGPSSSLAYGASKGGANGFGMTLANHLAPRGIRVNVLCPGNIVTEMKLSVDVAGAEREGRSVDEALERAKQNYGTPDGVARVIGFMISDEADYLRGAVFTR